MGVRQTCLLRVQAVGPELGDQWGFVSRRYGWFWIERSPFAGRCGETCRCAWVGLKDGEGMQISTVWGYKRPVRGMGALGRVVGASTVRP